MNKRANFLFVLAFVGSLFVVPGLIFLRGMDNQVASYENRMLADFPDLTGEQVLSGEFDGIETWLSDHVPLRESFIKLNTWIDSRIFRKPVVNDIVLGEVLLPFNTFGDWGLDYLTPLAQTYVVGQMELQTLVESWGGAYCYVSVPLQNSYFNDAYPDYIASRDWHIQGMSQALSTAAQAQGLSYLDMMEVFQAQGMPEDYYAKSDHHYTYQGAYVTYQATMDYLADRYGLDLPRLTQDNFEIVPLENHFLGSRNREIYDLWQGEESLLIGVQSQEVAFQRWDNGQEVPATLYTIGADTVTYDTYMGGDVGETRIITDRPDLPNVLIFGASFTNPLETLFYTGFNELRSLDLRYYTQQGVLSYVAEYQPDVVICVLDDHSLITNGENSVIGW